MALGTTLRTLIRKAKKDFPGVSDADVRQYARLQVNVALDNLAVRDDDTLAKLVDEAFGAAVEAGEDWAVAMKNSVRDNIVRPLVVKAREKGVDPVPAIVMQTDLTEAQAAAMIESLDADTISTDDEVDLGDQTETEGERELATVGAADTI